MAFTRISELLWSWDPFTQLPSDAKVLWLTLYTGPTAKRLVPGLWNGTPNQMADESRLPSVETINAFDKLLDRELVEYDPKTRVLRLCELPDAGDWPSAPAIMIGWWKKFQSLPACPVRDAHVSTLRWMLEAGARDAEKNVSKKPSAKHEEIWSQTFGLISVPVHRRRGLRRADADTGTAVQPSLFSSPSFSPSQASVSGSGSGSEVALPVAIDVDSSTDPGSDPDSNKINIRETHSSGSGEGDFFSSSGEADPGSGLPGDRDRDPPRPKLVLVPMPAPTTTLLALSVDAFVQRLAEHWPYKPVLIRDETTHNALYWTIRELSDAGWGDRELDAVAKLIATSCKAEITSSDKQRWFQLADWIAIPGNVLRALADAHEHERKSAKACAELAEIKKTLGWSP